MSSVNQILIEKQGKVGIVNFQTDKLNVLLHSLRADLYQAIQQLLADAEVESIVLAGSNKAFSAGADIAEFSAGTYLNFPSLHDLVHLISDLAKPVTAAISGTALGGGLELALACHHRAVHAKAHLALPEVHLGLLQGAAGTQLLPRYIGVETALDAILTGKPLKLSALKDSALLDVLTDADVKQAAIEFASALGTQPVHIKHQRIQSTDALNDLLRKT
ncbi:enoyl-CoA hydratase/isomerase family protein [Acinetobacter johnsonii]|nr:enoyl-CoA hydratase/isomerase family protein [Acinetobacter johnsonii]